MKFELVKKEAMTFTGYSKEFSNEDGKNYQEIPMFWGELFQNGKHGLLVPLQDELGTVGVSYDWSNETNSFKYMVGVRNDTELAGAERIVFEAKTYAVFTVKGACPKSVQDAVDYIHRDFLPNGIYRHAGGPEIEVYPAGDAREETYVCYYWIPVEEK